MSHDFSGPLAPVCVQNSLGPYRPQVLVASTRPLKAAFTKSGMHRCNNQEKKHKFRKSKESKRILGGSHHPSLNGWADDVQGWTCAITLWRTRLTAVVSGHCPIKKIEKKNLEKI